MHFVKCECTWLENDLVINLRNWEIYSYVVIL